MREYAELDAVGVVARHRVELALRRRRRRESYADEAFVGVALRERSMQGVGARAREQRSVQGDLDPHAAAERPDRGHEHGLAREPAVAHHLGHVLVLALYRVG